MQQWPDAQPLSTNLTWLGNQYHSLDHQWWIFMEFQASLDNLWNRRENSLNSEPWLAAASGWRWDHKMLLWPPRCWPSDFICWRSLLQPGVNCRFDPFSQRQAGICRDQWQILVGNGWWNEISRNSDGALRFYWHDDYPSETTGPIF